MTYNVSSGTLNSTIPAMTLLVGHATRKIISEMTYNVSNGTSNPTIAYHSNACLLCLMNMHYLT